MMTEVVVYGVSERPEILRRQGDGHEFDTNLGYRDPVQNKQKVSRITLYREHTGAFTQVRVLSLGCQDASVVHSLRSRPFLGVPTFQGLSHDPAYLVVFWVFNLGIVF